MSTKTYIYHIMTANLPWYTDTSYLNAYPYIPPKKLFIEWCKNQKYQPNMFTDEEDFNSVYEKGITEFKRAFGLRELEYDINEYGQYKAVFGNGVERIFNVGGDGITESSNRDGNGDERVDKVGEYERPHQHLHQSRTKPWKLCVYHSGTERGHWHFVHISRNNQWGHNTRFGRSIRKSPYKCRAIKCVSCVSEYLYSGDGRQVLQDILDEVTIRSYSCPFHKSSLEGNAQRGTEVPDGENTERRLTVFEMESTTSSIRDRRVDSPTPSTYSCFDIESDQLQLGPYGNNTFRKTGPADAKNTTDGSHGITDEKLIDILVSQRAFNEGLAYQVLSKIPNGISYLFRPRIADKIKTGVSIARILVFQKKDHERLNMAVEYSQRMEPELNTQEAINEQIQCLIHILNLNKIDVYKFSQDTYNHFIGNLEKRNNLFFTGQPSTGNH